MIPTTSTAVTHTTGGRMRGLDGLRALAVIFVVFYHALPGVVPGGYIGVDLFFVISGFLITTLIAAEYTRRGAFDIRAFWVRRARRLLPALLLTVGVVCSVALFIGGDILVGIGRQIIGALTFSSNWLEIAAGTNYFDATTPHLFTNFWSLAVEEQFYITWPLIVVLFLSFPWRRPLRVSMVFCAVMAIISAALMAGIFIQTGNATRVYYGLDTHMFGLMAGATLAFYRLDRVSKKGTVLEVTKKKKWMTTLTVTASLIGLSAFALLLPDGSALAYEGGIAVATLIATICIASLLYSPTIWRRWLEHRTIRWVGVRSYGIYLWHWPIIVILRQEFPSLNVLISAGVIVLTSGVAAALSYRYVESPVRRQGILRFLRKGVMCEVATIDGAASRWKLRPHPVLPIVLLIIVATCGSVITAPTVTRAEQQIQMGQLAIQKAKVKAKLAAAAKPKVITGTEMTLIGDSVALASAPALEQRFPGIFIDAKVSRSLRGGGFQLVQQYVADGTMRQVVVIGLGTNGYYGAGNLDALMATIGSKRDVVFVTSHAPVPWIASNNADLISLQHRYKNVYLSQWDAAITLHPELLAPDGIHPGMAGGQIYADSIATALAQIKS